MATYDQDAFRGREDDGSETTANWIALLNTNFSRDIDSDPELRVRFVVQVGGGTPNPPNNVDFILMYSHNAGSYTQVTTGSSVIRSVLSSNFADGEDCTQQLGSGTFAADCNGMDEDGAIQTSFRDLALNTETELEWMLQIQARRCG